MIYLDTRLRLVQLTLMALGNAQFFHSLINLPTIFC